MTKLVIGRDLDGRKWAIFADSRPGQPVLSYIRTRKAAEYVARHMRSMDVDWTGDVQARFDSDREFRNRMFELKRICVTGDIPS